MPEVINQLLINEYKEKWSYVRHTEEMQNKSIQWYLAIVGGTLAYGLGKSGQMDLQNLSRALETDMARLLVHFLLLYSVFLAFLLLFQKRNYKRFTDRLLALEKKYCGLDHDFGGEHRVTVFRLRYSMVNLVGGACAALVALSWELGYSISVITFVAYVSLLYVMSLYKIFKH